MRVRKWFCRNRRCHRRIFTERLPTVAAPWARCTLRLAQRLVALGVALGGTAGVRLGHQWDQGVSRNTLLRLLRRQPAPSFPTPTVLGVDDFALRKRQTYGTVLIDLERRSPVALLPDRTADTVAQWLREHPGVKVIARDRSTAYAEGARHGAPAATQVADRFHLLQNLREALDQVFLTHEQTLDAVNALMHQQPVALSDGAVAVPVPPHDAPPPAQQRAAQRQARRQALHAGLGLAPPGAGRPRPLPSSLGMSLRTVQRDLRSATFAGRRRRSDRGESVLNPYKPYLLERWNAGCYTAMRLFRDLRQRGYAGAMAWLRPMPAACGRPRPAPRAPPPRQPLPAVAEPPCQPLTPRRATWLVLRREAHARRLRPSSSRSCAPNRPRSPRRSIWPRILRPGPPAATPALDPWLQRATTSTLEALQRFAKGLCEDYEAVKAGVTVPWSTGPVEGHIGRVHRRFAWGFEFTHV